MEKYHKIKTLFVRNPDTNHKHVVKWVWADPVFSYLIDNKWVLTEKIDGTNIRIGWDGESGHVHLGGRTDNSQIPANLVNRLGELFPSHALEQVFQATSVTLYGEGYGAGIQKAGKHYIPDGVNFILFDVRIGKWWLERDNVHDIARKLGIYAVPVVGRGNLMEAVEFAEAGFKSVFGEFTAEGIVMRPKVELLDRGGRRVIAKLKYKDFPR